MIPRVRRAEIPFIDREQALASLLEFTSQAEGRCRVVVGRRGIGKSRLLRHFMEQTASDEDLPGPERICVFHEPAAAPPLVSYTRLESSIAHHPKIRRLVERPGLDPWVPALTAWSRKIVRAADPVGGPALESLDVEELVVRLLRTERTLSPYDVTENFLKTLLFLSRTLATDQRLILVLDPRDPGSTGSSDPSRVQILQDVVRNLPERILVLMALRPSDRTGLLGGVLEQANVVESEDLGPFQIKDVENLLKTVFGRDVLPDDARRIHRKYGGDPRNLELAVEFVRRGTGDPIRRLRDEVPTNVFDLIRLNYEGLDHERDRLLLRILSIALEPVPLEFILAVGDVPGTPDAVDQSLRRADAPRPIERTIEMSGDRYQIDQLVWVEFLHHKSKSLGEFEQFQGAAGDYYEAEKRSFFALAHYALAGDLPGIRRHLSAGLEWHRIHGETLRIQELHKVLSDLPLEPPERFLLNKAYAWSWSQRGEAEEVLHHVEDLISECAEESFEQAELLILRGDAYHNSSRYEEAYRDFCDARDLLERLGFEETLPHRRARLEAAHIEIHLGEFTNSEAAHHDLWQRQALLTDPEDRRTLFQSAREIRRYGELLVFTGDWKGAREHLITALELFKDLGDWKGQGNALRRLADLDLLEGDERSLHSALAQASQAKELLVDIGGRGSGWMDLVLGEAHRGLAQMDQAFEAHGRAWERYADGESPHLKCMAQLALAECERFQTGTVRMESYDAAVARYEKLGFDWGSGTARIYRALGLFALGEEELAREDLAIAERIFQRMELRPPLETVRRIREESDLGFHPIIVL